MSDNGFPVAPGSQEPSSGALATTDSANEDISTDDLGGADSDLPVTPDVSDSFDAKSGGVKGFFKDSEMVHRLIILGFLVIFVAAIIFAVISFSSSGKSPESERKLGQYSTQDI